MCADSPRESSPGEMQFAAPLPEYDLLIVSDLHLSEGLNPETLRYSLNEDFFFDEEFARFLAYYRDPQRWPGRKWHLMINGDFLDFLQVVRTPPDSARQHPYGLPCGEPESVYKLGVIVEGHRPFFQALARFLAEGHAVTILRGNHDAEFCFPAVQAALRSRLRRILEESVPAPGEKSAEGRAVSFDDRALRFAAWFYYEPSLLWVEHGNQYDELNSFAWWLAPLLPKFSRGHQALRRATSVKTAQRADDIELPWGSLFVRYLFNKVECSFPYADNIKPAWKFLLWFLPNEPLRAAHFLLAHGIHMLRKMARAWTPVSSARYAERRAAHQRTFEELARAAALETAVLQHIEQLQATPILRRPQGVWHLIRWLTLGWWITVPVLLLALATTAASVVAALLFLLPGFPALRNTIASWSKEAPVGWLVVSWLVFLTVALPLLLPKVLAAWRIVKRKPRERSALALAAEKLAALLKVRYVVMGHTHETDIERLKDSAEYFNTGTWTKVFRPNEERLISEESELVFLQGLRRPAGLRMELLKWNDAAGQPRRVKLFGDS
jgi:UDP-2,3-diacylglucosamine pyrophosphatase LpxH